MSTSTSPSLARPLGTLPPDGPGVTLMVTGLVAQAVALAWMALVLDATPPYGELVPSFVLAGLGMGLTFGPSATAVLMDLEEGDHAVTTSANATLREIGVALGIAVLVAVFQGAGGQLSRAAYADGVPAAVGVGAAVVALGALAGLALPGRRRTHS